MKSANSYGTDHSSLTEKHIKNFFNTCTVSMHISKWSFLQILPTVAFLSSSGLITWIPQTVYFFFWAYPFLLFSFSVLHFSVVGSVLTHVGFRAHIKIVSRIVSNRKVMFSPRSSTAAMRTLLNGLNSGFIASRRSKTIFLVTVNNAYSATLRCDKWLR